MYMVEFFLFIPSIRLCFIYSKGGCRLVLGYISIICCLYVLLNSFYWKQNFPISPICLSVGWSVFLSGSFTSMLQSKHFLLFFCKQLLVLVFDLGLINSDYSQAVSNRGNSKQKARWGEYMLELAVMWPDCNHYI